MLLNQIGVMGRGRAIERCRQGRGREGKKQRRDEGLIFETFFPCVMKNAKNLKYIISNNGKISFHKHISPYLAALS